MGSRDVKWVGMTYNRLEPLLILYVTVSIGLRDNYEPGQEYGSVEL